MSKYILKPNLPKWDIDGKLKEYIVILKQSEDYNTFWQEMEWLIENHPTVPSRQVEIANERPFNDSTCHYVLTDEEAELLRNDPRVQYVEIPAEHRDDIIIKQATTQYGNFVIPNYQDPTSANIINWGLVRHSRIDDVYLGNIYPSPGANSYTYTYDGTGVDIIIQDSGIAPYHPEFQDSNGNNRVQRIDWWAATGQDTTPNLKVWANVSVHGDNSIRASNSTNWSAFAYPNEPALVFGGGQSMVNALGWGSEDSNRSFRLRSEGASIFVQSTYANTLVWECRFLDNGWIEMLVEKANVSNGADEAHWFGLVSASGGYIANANVELWFADPVMSTANASPRSLVLTRSTPTSKTWSINSGNNFSQSYHAELSSNTWVLVPGVATSKGWANLYQANTKIYSNYGRGYVFVNENVPFNTTIDFIFPPLKELSPNYYEDKSGHGTHCAGVAAGKTFGWAKNANIYSHKLSALQSTSSGGLSIADSFDLMKRWHDLKPVDPVTGFKRPTVVNASWVSQNPVLYYPDTGNVVYRGVRYDASDTANNFTGGFDYGLSAYNPYPSIEFHTMLRVGSTDSALENAVSNGIIYLHAAGNNNDYHDIPSGPDYNNYLISATYGNVYYSRGSSPTSPNVINVGSIDALNGVQLNHSLYDIYTGGNLNLKASYSAAGRYVDIWAAGSMIMSSTSNVTNDVGTAGAYYANPSYKQIAINGTSMAAPQVAGIAALYLQVNPGSNFKQFKEWLSNAGSVANVIFNSGDDTAFGGPYISSQVGNFANIRAGYAQRNLLASPNKLVYSGNIYPIPGIASLIYLGGGGNNNSNATFTGNIYYGPGIGFSGPITFKNINIIFV